MLPSHFAVINTKYGKTFILIRRKAGYSKFDNYSVYEWDDIMQIVIKRSVCEIKVHKIKLKTYAPYIFDSMALVSYMLAYKRFKYYSQIVLDDNKLEVLVGEYLLAYRRGEIDNDLVCHP